MLNVPAPGSKSTVSEKTPVAYTFPDASTVMEYPLSSKVLPTALAQRKLPAASNF